MTKVMAFAAAVLLAACAGREKPRPVDIKTQVVEVAVRAACPDPAERERLHAARPIRLADHPMPERARERVAKANGHIGRYEAPGGLADQVDAALDRCQRP